MHSRKICAPRTRTGVTQIKKRGPYRSTHLRYRQTPYESKP
nr:MAG TPA: hypothetical protein [Caudoviricetes sp.]